MNFGRAVSGNIRCSIRPRDDSDDCTLFLRVDTGKPADSPPYFGQAVRHLELTWIETGEGGHSNGINSVAEYGKVSDLIQSIVDAAWAAGIRPSTTALQKEAENLHLSDMRKIVFHKLGIKNDRA